MGRMPKDAFVVEPDANKFDASKLHDEGCRSLIANIIYFSVCDLAYETYKRKIGITQFLNDSKYTSAIRFFNSDFYDDYAQYIRFQLSGKQIIDMVRSDPERFLDEHYIHTADRMLRAERNLDYRFGKCEDGEFDA